MVFNFNKNNIIDILQKGITQEILDNTVSDLKLQKENVCELVQILGPALCAKENDIRLMGTQFFIEILKNLDSNQLSDTEVQVIWRFLIDRLNDHHSVIPTILTGALGLLQNQHISYKCFAEFIRKMFQCIICQTQKREDRTTIFKLIELASQSKAKEFKDMGADWIYGVINAIEGERDPRNLLFIFQFMPQFIQDYSLFHLTEETFEVFAVYFPVDFTPVQNDPNAITRDLLAEHLENCLTATSDFVDNCIELLLEKLSSDLTTAKIDCLKLLIRLSKNCPSTKLEIHFKTIWNAICTEIKMEKNKEMETITLMTLKSLMHCLAQENDTCENTMNIIFDTTLSEISNINSTLFERYHKLICSCLNSSPKATLHGATKVLPILISQYRMVLDPEKNTVLEAILSVCEALDNQNVIKHLIEEVQVMLLNEIKFILTQEEEPSLLQKCIQLLIITVKIIPKDMRFDIYSKLLQLSTDEKYCDLNGNVSQLITISYRNFPDEVLSFVLNPLMELTSTCTHVLPMQVLIQLMFSECLVNSIDSFVFQHLFTINQKNERLCCEALGYMVNVLKTKAGAIRNQITTLEDIILFLHTNPQQSLEFMTQTKNLIEILMEMSDIDIQQKIISKFYAELQPTNKNDLYILSGILGHMDPEIHLNNNFEQFLQTLIKISSETGDKECQMLCNYLLCSLFNKIPQNSFYAQIIKNILGNLTKELKTKKKQSVEVFAWVTKGLLMRGYSDYDGIINPILELLNHESLSSSAILVFDIYSTEVTYIHLPLIKYLYKQKVFNFILKELEKKIDCSEVHVTALIIMMSCTPYAVLKINLYKLGKVIITGLSNKTSRCVLACLNILKKFIAEQDEYFLPYISKIVDQLLNLTQCEKAMDLRIAAFECLSMLSTFPTYLLLPLKDKVTYGVTSSLDDRKRLVRAAAVRARLKWYMVGTSESESIAN